MDELAAVLHRERQLLENLLFRLRIASHLLEEGEARFLARAAGDLERAAEAVRDVELRRARLVAYDHAPAGDLRALVAGVGEPFATLFCEHRGALADLVAEVDVAYDRTERLARTGLEAAGGGGGGCGDDLDREIEAAAYGSMCAASAPLALPDLSTYVA